MQPDQKDWLLLVVLPQIGSQTQAESTMPVPEPRIVCRCECGAVNRRSFGAARRQQHEAGVAAADSATMTRQTQTLLPPQIETGRASKCQQLFTSATLLVSELNAAAAAPQQPATRRTQRQCQVRDPVYTVNA
jgi:hypothetical protein